MGRKRYIIKIKEGAVTFEKIYDKHDIDGALDECLVWYKRWMDSARNVTDDCWNKMIDTYAAYVMTDIGPIMLPFYRLMDIGWEKRER